MQSGLWVDSQRRYRQLLVGDRMTLTDAFGRAGWRTVFDVPANTEDWPEGKEFYRFDDYYDSRNVDYRGPEFGYAPMPDQYTLADFHRRELAPADRPPVMAEIDLISSHHPWTPLPRLVDWDEVGDGSVFDGMPEQGTHVEGGVRRPRGGQEGLRRVGRVLARHPDVVPRHLSGPRPRAGRAGRPPAALVRQRPGRRSRRPGDGHRPGPGGAGPDLRVGLARRAAPAPGRAGLADGRLPRPLPRRVQLQLEHRFTR